MKRVCMATKTNKITVPLIIEPHPIGYVGYPFITLIQYNKEHILTIVDNSDASQVQVFVLDLCGPENVDESMVVEVANEWYHHSSSKFPLSFEFSRRGLTEQTSKIFKSYSIDFITRVIGPLPKFAMDATRNVRRRKRKEIPAGLTVVVKQ